LRPKRLRSWWRLVFTEDKLSLIWLKNDRLKIGVLVLHSNCFYIQFLTLLADLSCRVVLLCAVQPLSPLEVSVSTTTLIGSALLLEECFFLRPGHVQHLQNTVQLAYDCSSPSIRSPRHPSRRRRSRA
jgi:hypothetical protein